MYLATDGLRPAEAMLAAAEDANAALAWGLRALSLVLAAAGLAMVAAPVSVAADVVPCIGPMIGDLASAALCCVRCGRRRMLAGGAGGDGGKGKREGLREGGGWGGREGRRGGVNCK